MKNILIISPDRWEAHTVSKHHYAMTLALMGARVFFLNPPDTPGTGLDIARSAYHSDLYIVSTKKVAPGLRFLPAFLRRRLEANWLTRLEQRAGVKIDVVWLFENSRFFDLGFAGHRLKIYHQVDLNQNFNLRKAVATADICLCTTELIKERITEGGGGVHKIHHGLSEPPEFTPLTDEQAHRLAKDRVNAVYVGNLDMRYLDVDLLSNLAINFEHIRFHFVGGYSEHSKLRLKTAHLPNIVWWGRVDNWLIPAILDAADVLLVTYMRDHWRDQASPHKMMEYLASGKTVVATYTDEYKDKADLVEMAHDSRDYLTIFERVVNNLDRFNSKSKAEDRRKFAAAHTYRKNITKINGLLQSQGLTALFDR